MKVILYTHGSLGDFNPILLLGVYLKTIGCDVLILGSEKFESHLENSGLKFGAISTSESYDNAYSNNQASSSLSHQLEFQIPAIEKTFKTIEMAYLTNGIDLIVGAGNNNNGAQWAAEEFQIPYIKVTLSPHASNKIFFFERVYGRKFKNIFFRIFNLTKHLRLYFIIVRPILNPLRRQLGLIPLKVMSSYRLGMSLPEVAMFPQWFCDDGVKSIENIVFSSFPFANLVNHDKRSLVEAQIADASKFIIAFATGSHNSNLSIELDEANQACKILGICGYFVNAHVTRLNVRNFENLVIVDYVDYEYLFNKVNIVCHHGGIGTISQAIKARTKQIIRPRVFDQFDNGCRVSSLGVGAVLSQSFDPTALAALIKNLIQDKSMGKKVACLADRLSEENGLEVIANYLSDSIMLTKLSIKKK